MTDINKEDEFKDDIDSLINLKHKIIMGYKPLLINRKLQQQQQDHTSISIKTKKKRNRTDSNSDNSENEDNSRKEQKTKTTKPFYTISKNNNRKNLSILDLYDETFSLLQESDLISYNSLVISDIDKCERSNLTIERYSNQQQQPSNNNNIENNNNENKNKNKNSLLSNAWGNINQISDYVKKDINNKNNNNNNNYFEMARCPSILEYQLSTQPDQE